MIIKPIFYSYIISKYIQQMLFFFFFFFGSLIVEKRQEVVQVAKKIL
jgi:hypothetical protein